MAGEGSTVPTIRRALRTHIGLDPGDAAWRGLVGRAQREVRVDVDAIPDGRLVVSVRAQTAGATASEVAAARAFLLVNGELVLGRLRGTPDGVLLEHAILGGHTLEEHEVLVAVWAVAWAAGAFASRIDARLAGREPEGSPPDPHAEERRNTASALEQSERWVERLLGEHYGSFDHDPAWGYHGPFGSARVFVSVARYLETSTVVRVASPVLVDVDLTDALALDAYRLYADRVAGRFAYLPERRELWLEQPVLGDALDAEELTAAVDAVARLADAEDDRLRATHGGQRYVDLAGGE
jgi:hypothetical protein